MALSLLCSEFVVERDEQKCITCQVCVRQCANDVHTYDPEDDQVTSDSSPCIGCHRCVTLCPTQAITISRNPLYFKE
ncbi:MAG: 4Fe-4S dicluster domain-containing protein, partial [Candidatus Latescibacteria bacterium]|nr:4Fe-4S dicluster domain-containing protein [Candidatus Latescibacterota bacterium]